MPALLEFQSVSKSFGKHSVLKDISLSVEGGEFLTFLGPSGSGKTTLLRLAGGFESVDSGKVLLNGEDISHLPPYRRRINTVFQSYALFPHLNVHENIAFGLKNLRLGRATIVEKVASALEMVQLTGFEERYPHQLSGGQQQRVALARALVMQPLVLLLDEPFGALDQKLRRQMQAELKALQRKLALTFVFVTHDQEEALSLSDRIVLLHEGQLEQAGRPEEIFNRPRSRFAAEFMGVENIFSVAGIKPNGSCVVCRLETGDEFEVEAGNTQQECRFLAIRSGQITISRIAAHPRKGNLVRGRILERSYLGDMVVWSVDAGGKQNWIVSQPAGLQSSEALLVGEEVFLEWQSSRGLLLS